MNPHDPSHISAKSKSGAVRKRYQLLVDERSSWRTHWSEITDYLLPRRGRYLLEDPSTKGRKRSNKIIDNTGGQSLRTLSAGMMSGMTSPARPWFRLRTPDPALMNVTGVKDWLGSVERIMRGILNRSNFYTMAPTAYTELGAFGTTAVYRRKHPSRVMHFRPFTAGEYVIAENEFNEPDTLGREFNMTVAQVVEQFVFAKQSKKFKWDTVSKAVHNLWNQRNYDAPVTIIHMIQPRRSSDRDPTRLDGKNQPVMDCYVERGADTEVLLSESGYRKFPAYAPRWDVLGGDVYGVSPGMEHLGDIKQLQLQQRRLQQGIDKQVNPPMVASLSLKGKAATVLPGGTTYVDPANGNQGFQPAYLVTPQVRDMGLAIQQVQERIQRGFYADLFAMMINSDRRQMTATEVAERHEEKLVLLGPVLQRLNTEFLDPLIDDVFMFALEAGMLPPIPEELQGVDLIVQYVSLLAQAQEAVSASAIERTFSFAGNLSAVLPDILDNLDADLALQRYGEILGMEPELIREKVDIERTRAARAEKIQAQEQMAMVGQGAQAAQVLSQADTQNPNALTALLQGGQQTVI